MPDSFTDFATFDNIEYELLVLTARIIDALRHQPSSTTPEWVQWEENFYREVVCYHIIMLNTCTYYSLRMLLLSWIGYTRASVATP